MTWCPWPTFHAPPTLSKFYVKSRNKVNFSATVIAGSMKPCIVIVLNNHTIWRDLDLHFMLHWLCQNFMLSLEIWCISLQYSLEYETLQHNCAWHTLWAHTMTRCSWLCPFLSAVAMALSMKPCIVVVLDTLFKHTPWPFFAWPTLHAVVISRNAGAISTSAEFLFLVVIFVELCNDSDQTWFCCSLKFSRSLRKSWKPCLETLRMLMNGN